MPIPLQCSRCGKRFRVADALAGKSAKCPCGARLSIPLGEPKVAPSAGSPPLAASVGAPSFYEQELSTPAPQFRLETPNEHGERLLHENNPFKAPYHDLAEKLLAPGSPRLLQLLAATIVGGCLGFGSAVKLREQTTQMTIGATIGGAIIGALVGLLLLTSDALRTRKSTGRRVPWLLNLYLGRGWLSILVWIITAFAGALLFVAYLVMTTA
jgi:hypothetical protein